MTIGRTGKEYAGDLQLSILLQIECPLTPSLICGIPYANADEVVPLLPVFG